MGPPNKMKKFIPLILLALIACNNYAPRDDNDSHSSSTNPTGPTTTGPIRVEYRVTGNAAGARVRYSDSINGLAQVVTTLPFNTTITTNDSSIFVSLEATPTSYPFLVTFPFLSIQIFTNGILFREASSSDAILNTLSISGTYRR